MLSKAWVVCWNGVSTSTLLVAFPLWLSSPDAIFGHQEILLRLIALFLFQFGSVSSLEDLKSHRMSVLQRKGAVLLLTCMAFFTESVQLSIWVLFSTWSWRWCRAKPGEQTCCIPQEKLEAWALLVGIVHKFCTEALGGTVHREMQWLNHVLCPLFTKAKGRC